MMTSRRFTFDRRATRPIGRFRRQLLALAIVTAIPPIAPRTGFAAGIESCDVADVVAKALPAIVNITVGKVVGPKDNAVGQGPLGATVSTADVKSKDQRFEIAVGSGSIVDPSGIIITNRHVIQDAAIIWVTFNDRSRLPARLIAASGGIDLAILKVDAGRPLPALAFGDSEAARIGQQVIAVGNPLGIGTSVSTGVISGLNRDLMRTPVDDFIQTDASINPGNSGGPLLDCAGHLLGVDTALVSNNSLLGSIGLGFALPARDAHIVLQRLVGSPTESPNWVGLHLEDVDAQLAAVFDRPTVAGAIVTDVDAGSPAAQAGVQPGDIITAVNGAPAEDARSATFTIAILPFNQPIKLAFWHDGQMKDATVKGEPWPGMMARRADVLASPANIAIALSKGVGFHLSPLTAADRARLHVTSGVLIDSVVPGSHADSIGLKPNDVIERVDNRPARVPEDVMNLIDNGQTAHDGFRALLVHSPSGNRWKALYVGKIDPNQLLVPDMANAAAGHSSDAAAIGK